MSRIIAVANAKGGVGKTTTAVNISAALAELGYRVLAIDLDPQSSLTLSLALDPLRVPGTLCDLLNAEGDLLKAPIVHLQEHWDVIPSNEDLRAIEHELDSDPKKIHMVGAALRPLAPLYDFIVLDCPASTGVMVGAALAAADEVIVPLTPDFLAFQVSAVLFRIIQRVQETINPQLRIAGIFLTMYDTRTRHARDILTHIRKTYGASVPFFSAVIHQSVKLKEAPCEGQSILKYAPQSQGARAYRVLAREIVEGIARPKRPGRDRRPEPAAAPELEPDAVEPRAPAVRAAELAPLHAAATRMALALAEPNPSPLGDAAQEEPPPARVALQGEITANPEPRALVLAGEAIPGPTPARTYRFSIAAPGAWTLEPATIATAGVPFVQVGDEPPGADILQAEPGWEPDSIPLFDYRAAEQNPEDVNVWLRRAETARLPQMALTAWLRVLQLTPTNGYARGELEQLVKTWVETATRVQAGELLRLGHTLVEAGQLACADQAYARVIDLEPRAYRAWLGRALVASNPLDRLVYVQRGLELSPNDEEIQTALADAREHLTADANRLLEEALELEEAGKMGEAHECFKQVIELTPLDDRAWLGCARTTEDLPSKLSSLNQALQINRGNVEAQELYRRLAESGGEPAFERLTRFAVDPKLVYLVLGLIVFVIALVVIPPLVRR